MMLVLRGAAAALLVVASVCGQSSNPLFAGQEAAQAVDRRIGRHVDRSALMAVVRRLSGPEFEGRAAGTPGGISAGQFVVRQFRRIGLAPVGRAGFAHPVRLAQAGGGMGRMTGQGRQGANIVGAIDGARAGARVIVVSAHYDHVGRLNGVLHAGADDNASGVAVLLAAATHFARHPPRHRMLFVAFDGEEISLAGSGAFIAAPPVPVGSIVLNVNLDMVSRSTRRELFAAGTSHTPSLQPVLEDVGRRAPVRLLLGHDRQDDPGQNDWTRDSDHWSFHNAGIPFVYFGVENHPDYHRPGDTAEKIDAGFFGDVADTIVEAIVALDRALATAGSATRP
jgi:hypothetical protein